MKRNPFSLPTRSAWLTRGAASAIASATLAAGVLATPAGASARVAQVAPVVSCPSASAVTGRAGFSVPAATSYSATNTNKSGQFAGVTETSTICNYGTPSAQNMRYIILIFGRLSKTIPVGQVQSYLKAQLQRSNTKMPPGFSFNYKFGTQNGVPNVWISGSATIETYHLNFHGAFGYQGTKVAGAEGLNVSLSKVNSLESLAFSTIGI